MYAFKKQWSLQIGLLAQLEHSDTKSVLWRYDIYIDVCGSNAGLQFSWPIW